MIQVWAQYRVLRDSPLNKIVVNLSIIQNNIGITIAHNTDYYCHYCSAMIFNAKQIKYLKSMNRICCDDCADMFNTRARRAREALLWAYMQLRACLVGDVARLVVQLWLCEGLK